MKRRLRVPGALVFTLGSVTALVAASGVSISCGDDEPPKDAMTCGVFCFEVHSDGGVSPPDGGCPLCADLSISPPCPAGCEPLG